MADLMKYTVDPLVQARRFVVLGTASGTYYKSAPDLTVENAVVISELIASGRGSEVLAMVNHVSQEGLAAKQSPTLFVLAMLTRCDNDAVRSEALALVPSICRTFTMLAEFLNYHQAGVTKPEGGGSGWGVGLRRAVSSWFIEKKNAESLAYHCLKYRNRNGWKPRDVLRKAHVRPWSPDVDALFCFLVNDKLSDKKSGGPDTLRVDAFIRAFQAVQNPETSGAVAVELIREHNLAHEHLGAHLLKLRTVWGAMIRNKMPITALIRNLGQLTAKDILFEGDELSKFVAEQIVDEEMLRHGRVHPFSVLLAMTTYESGRGEKGKLVWKPVPSIVQALEKAFYLSFKNVVPTGKRIVIGLDVSGSMQGQGIMGTNMSAATAAAALTMQFVKTEEHVRVKAFSRTLIDFPIGRDSLLDDIMSKANSISFGSTNCAAPMQWAEENKVPTDVFIIITDNETNTSEPPVTALKRYRDVMGIEDAKLVVLGLTSTEFSIADPKDPNMLDVVGFDSEAPRIVELFMRGEI